MTWDASSRDAWAKALGVVPVPLFGPARTEKPDGEFDVLLDGRAASFALLASGDVELLLGDDPLTWSWSSDLRRALFVNTKTGEVFVRAWGDKKGDRRRLRPPRSAAEAQELFHDEIVGSRRPRSDDVVTRVLAAFKSVRAALVPYGADSVTIIKTFNLLISLAESLNDIDRFRSIDEAQSALGYDDDDLKRFATVPLDEVTYLFANIAPPGVPQLDAGLLIRHASSQLYQEAHFELERQEHIQLTLFGREPSKETRGTQQRDARYTPTALARSLVEQALPHLPINRDLVIVDPACGSGIFLLEALRELELRRHKGHILLKGLDSSPVSEAIANFCLSRATAESRAAGIDVDYEIHKCDAMTEDWGSANLVLMNPPFASCTDMSIEERTRAREVLGPAGTGNFDKSMVFLFKAAETVKKDGVMASVMPSMLFETTSGRPWRREMLDRVSIRLLGRFHGYSFFPGALVEPGFIVATGLNSSDQQKSAILLDARDGAEDAALRDLRKGPLGAVTQNPHIHIRFDYSSSLLDETSWMPRSFDHEELIAVLGGTTRVKDIFDVQQGAHAGANEAFFITELEWRSLPAEERPYFRAAAGTKTIRGGRLLRTEYVFYPYNENGLLIDTEDELKKRLKRFYADHFRHFHDILLHRPSVMTDKWWTLKRPRPFQYKRARKILTAYFGAVGKFAYDETGDFVSVQGYAWLPCKPAVEIQGDEGDVSIDFFDTSLPKAYIGLLNSRPFSVLLSCFCPTVQGGQYNLSKRFVDQVPLPDLCQSDMPPDLVWDLAEVGEMLSLGEAVDHRRLSELVAKAYAVPLPQWKLEPDRDRY